MMHNAPHDHSAKGKLLMSMALFGTIGVFVRNIPLPSSVIALARGLIGTLFLLAVVSVKGLRLSLPDIRRNLVKLCLAGVFLGGNWILLFEAYRYTTVATATLCYYLSPIFVMLVSPMLFHERLTPFKLFCVALAFIGMALVSGVTGAEPLNQSETIGILLGVGAAVLYACIVLLNKSLQGIAQYDTTIVQLGISAIVLLPYVCLTERMAEMTFAPRTALLLSVVGVVHTGVAYALYFGSVRGLPAQTVAMFSYIDPIVAILLSALLLGERMGLIGIVGAAMVLGATFFCQRVHHKT